MSSKLILTVFGATGNQGGNVIDTVLSKPDLAAKYDLRGITRDPKSRKSQALAQKGVEMIKADLNDRSSIEAATKGAHGVFAMTDYWSLLDKDKEILQGKTIVDACKNTGVKHLVWSSLPYVTKLSNGKYTGVAHFDSKATVEEYAESVKGGMVVSYFMPAMFMDVVKQITQEVDGVLTLSLPFPDPNIPWPLLSPSRDSGKYVVGLFEGRVAANGVQVRAVSTWTTPAQVMESLKNRTGKDAKFNSLPVKVYEGYLPEEVRADMSDMMQWIGESSYYGKGTEQEQARSDKWLIKDAKLTTWEEFVDLEFN
ncbi:hypothetical protein KCU93_g3582, partial [Aureobasidium melanogenum]